MRSLLLSLTILFIVQVSTGQDQWKYLRDSADLQKVKSLKLMLDTSRHQKGSLILPFSSIIIKDVRFDTAQIGLYSQVSDVLFRTIKNYRVNVKDGVSKGLNQYFNHYLQNNLGTGSNSIVCFVKKFTVVGRDTLRDNVPINKTNAQLVFNAEFFLKKGNEYFAAFKCDTVITGEVGVKRKEITDEIYQSMLRPLLEGLGRKLYETNWSKIEQKKVFTETIVQENYFTNRFNVPILTCTAFKKGVYRNFSEFKSNKPSIEHFNYKTDRYYLTTITDGNGNNLNPGKIFGFSDGKRIWIQKMGSSFPLIRTGNSFQFFWTLVGETKMLLCVDMEKGTIL